MPAAVLPVVARAVVARAVGVLLLAVGHPEALRGQVPVVRVVPEPAAAAPGVVVEADVTLELPPGAVAVVRAVGEAVVQVEGAEAAEAAEAADVPANQPKSLFPALANLPSFKPQPALFSFPLLFP